MLCMRSAVGLLVLLLSMPFGGIAQNWQFEEKAPMPEAVSNNAVTAAWVNGKAYVYSFAGMDTSKDQAGIHLRSFRYDVAADSWDTLPPLPDAQGKIAAAASTIQNKIYIAGGYYVQPNGDETSSNHIHRFDPATNSFLTDGARVPIHTDDHVQAVWRDSLLYVITGWNDSVPGPLQGGNNIQHVQIYDPASDSWAMGTPVPNNANYKVFGGSGVIIGDTIFYAGGVEDSNFDIVPAFRKGVIDPIDPTNITWSFFADSAVLLYRSGAIAYKDRPAWIGGASHPYNFDALEYGTNNPVEPVQQMMGYANGVLSTITTNVPAIMDLRGVAKLAEGQYVITGGILPGQQVSHKTYLITDGLAGVSGPSETKEGFVLYPNPANGVVSLSWPATALFSGSICILDIMGKRAMPPCPISTNKATLDISHLSRGIYFVQVSGKDGIWTLKLVVQR